MPRLNSPIARPSATRSSLAARRLGTGSPLVPAWVGELVVLQPQAPASIEARSRSCIVRVSSSVAARSHAACPIALRRSGLWPTSGIMFSPRPMSMASRYSPKVSHVHGSTEASERNGRSSTQQKVASIGSRCSGRSGASVRPQLPVSTVVTPCQMDEVQSRSQNGWAS